MCLNSRTTDASCFVEDIGRFIVIAFEGTARAEDFVQDAKFLRCEIGPGLAVHHGFWEDVFSLMPKILRALQGQGAEVRGQRSEVGKDGALTSGDSGRPPHSGLLTLHSTLSTPHYSKPLLITGHSLGADLAILAAWILKNEDGAARQHRPTVAAVYAFAPARPGNRLFQAYYDALLWERTFCIVNEDDPVPMLPPLGFGYRRVGQLVFLRGIVDRINRINRMEDSQSCKSCKSCLEINPGLGRMAWLNLCGAWQAWRRGREAFLPNHAIERYLENLRGIQSKAEIGRAES